MKWQILLILEAMQNVIELSNFMTKNRGVVQFLHTI
jgi:hypothetical protein